MFLFLDPPDLIEGLADVTKNESDIVNFTCTFVGFPTPVVEWMSPMEGLLPQKVTEFNENLGLYITQSTLEISVISPDHEGLYTCTGTNGVPNLIKAVNYSSAFLTVQGE